MNIGFQGWFLQHPYTGIGQYTRGLLRAFGKQTRHQITLLTPIDPGEDFGPTVEVSINPVSGFLPKRLTRHFWEQYSARHFFKRKHVDLIHFPYPAHFWKASALPTLTTIHDTLPWIYSRYQKTGLTAWYHKKREMAARLSTQIVTVSEFSKQEIVRVCSIQPEAITVIPNGIAEHFHRIDRELARATLFQWGLEQGKYFLYSGGYDIRKNVSTLVKAFLKFCREHHGATLVLAGGQLYNDSLYQENGLNDFSFEEENGPLLEDDPPKGSHPQVENISYEVAHLDNGSRIIRTGFITESQLRTLYQGCRAFVHLSTYEGFNLPVIEAASCGVPLILSDIPVHHEVAGDSALYVPAKDVDQICDTLLDLWSAREVVEDYSQRSLELAKQYNWEQSAQAHLDLYEAIAG